MPLLVFFTNSKRIVLLVENTNNGAKEKQSQILMDIIDQLKTHKTLIFKDIQKYINRKPFYLENKNIFFTFIDFFYIDNTISNLFSLDFEYFPKPLIDELKSYYLDLRKELYFVHQYWEGCRERLIEMMEHLVTCKFGFDLNLEKIKNKIETEIKK